jgi:predicted nucleic acid-binding protein
MRFVFDTNTVVTALLFRDSVPGKAFYFALAHGTLLISSATIAELTEVISRRKFDKYLTNDEREEFVESLLTKAEIVEILQKT